MLIARLLVAIALCLTATLAQAAGFRLIDVPADADGPAIEGAIWYLCSEPPGEIDLGRSVTAPGVKDCRSAATSCRSSSSRMAGAAPSSTFTIQPRRSPMPALSIRNASVSLGSRADEVSSKKASNRCCPACCLKYLDLLENAGYVTIRQIPHWGLGKPRIAPSRSSAAPRSLYPAVLILFSNRLDYYPYGGD